MKAFGPNSRVDEMVGGLQTNSRKFSAVVLIDTEVDISGILLLAYTNDNVPAEDLPATSGGLVFTFGLGAIIGPIAIGFAMDAFGPFAFWIVLGGTFAAIVLYAFYRMSQTEALPISETDAYLNLVPTASVVAVADAANWAAENAEAEVVVG